MRGLAWYYVTRLAMVALWLVVATVGGLPWWANVLSAAAMAAYFLWVPRSGRYPIREDQPLAPLRRDERSQAISGRAARWAFAVETLLAGAVVLWAGSSGRQELSSVLSLVLVAGWLTYFVAQGWLGRKS
jgi:hypothetical protein